MPLTYAGFRVHRVLPLVALLSAGSLAHAAPAGVPEGWFVWPSVEPVDGSALDTSALNPTPAGAQGRVTVRAGEFVAGDGSPIRFWGVNFSGSNAFPSAEDAEIIARRLAKGGVNIARLHHLDNTWGIDEGGSLWPKGRGTRDVIAPGPLDALHRLVATLKRHGIYANVNLKVSKVLSEADDFPASIAQLPLFQKRADIFQRRMIDLQKDYARQLLTAVNPYTGLSLAEDPAVAVVEINNENSLLGYWTRDLGRGLDKFPEPFRGELAGLWNAWLVRRYVDDDALRDAWRPAAAAGSETVSLIPAGAAWHGKPRPGTLARLESAGPQAFTITVDQASGIPWHAQYSVRGLSLQDGRVYTIAFEARADRARPIEVGVGLDGEARPGDDWRSFGLLESAAIGTSWTQVRLVFPAHSVSGDPAALSFNAAATTGRIEVRDLRLIEGCEGAGLQPGQTLRNASVPIPTAPSARQWADWIHFLADTERAFADEMRAFLRDELGVQAPIACSQIDYGGLTGLWREQPMDFADAHAYWQHPDFASGADWDPNRWSIKNSSQIAELGERAFAGFGVLALTRVAGKPYTVSEYDHPAPSDFVCEMYPTVAAFASRQDWNGIYLFDLAEYGSRNPEGALRGFFDQVNHPAKWAFAPFATRVFRGGLVERAASRATLHLGSPVWAEQPHADLLWRKLLPAGPIAFLDQRLAVDDGPELSDTRARVAIEGEVAPGPVSIQTGSRGRIFRVAAPAAAAVVGQIGGAAADAGALHVACAEFGRGFAAVTAVALDGLALTESQRVLISLAARGGNQGMVWNAERTSVGSGWGQAPTIAERVPATVTLRGSQARSIFALAPDGTRAARVAATPVDGGLRFTVRAEDATMHYEVIAE